VKGGRKRKEKRREEGVREEKRKKRLNPPNQNLGYGLANSTELLKVC